MAVCRVVLWLRTHHLIVIVKRYRDCNAKTLHILHSYPSFQLRLVDWTVVEQKTDGVNLANIFVDDVRISRVVVAQQTTRWRYE